MDYEFKIGTPVYSREGEAGRLKFLVIDPRDEEITALVVERGTLLHKDRVVPVSWVEKANEQGVVLNASVPELETLPEYREIDFRTPDPTGGPISGHLASEMLIWIAPYPGIYRFEQAWVQHRGRIGVSDDEVLVKRGQSVYTSDGERTGTLDHVLVDDETKRIMHLVVHRGHWLQRGEDLIVPAEAVSSVTNEKIYLKLSQQELDELPRYQPAMSDAKLEQVITRGLQTQPETRDQPITVQVDRGVVRLFGHAGEAAALAASSLVGRVQGVIGLEDHIVRKSMTGANGPARDNRSAGKQDNDKAIAARIREVFRRERREDLSDVRVHVDQGVAYLSGTTPNIAGKALAEQVASATPGVRSVVNGIEADMVVRARVEAALGEDPRTALSPIEVICRAGVVTLLGEVPSVEAKEAAEQIARSTAGVVAVLNELAARPPGVEPANAQPAWQEALG